MMKSKNTIFGRYKRKEDTTWSKWEIYDSYSKAVTATTFYAGRTGQKRIKIVNPKDLEKFLKDNKL